MKARSQQAPAQAPARVGAPRMAAREVRIIGGLWKRSKLPVADSPGLRPTPDRVRETLFNWLGPRVPGARVLDLFAGSGALGLEALSRGAAAVSFIEKDAHAAQALRELLGVWGARGAQVFQCDALRYLAGPPAPADLVFLDPPFDSQLLVPALAGLAGGWLAAGALLYVELAARASLPELPAGWRAVRAKRAGEVGYHLLQTGGSSRP